MSKHRIQALLQNFLGYRNYLFLFSLFTIVRIKWLGYEKGFLYFCRLIPKEGVILDIGANIGVMSVCMAQKCPGSMVYAFEPIAEAADTWERVVTFYSLKNVQLFRTALGNQNGETTMQLPVKHGSRLHGLSNIQEPDFLPEAGGLQYRVPITRLDDMEALDHITSVSAIKIDVENYEVFVFRGGEKLIRKHKPLIFCEVWNNPAGSACREFLSGLGYSIHYFDGNKLQPYTGQTVLDLFFLPSKVSDLMNQKP